MRNAIFVKFILELCVQSFLGGNLTEIIKLSEKKIASIFARKKKKWL